MRDAANANTSVHPVSLPINPLDKQPPRERTAGNSAWQLGLRWLGSGLLIWIAALIVPLTLANQWLQSRVFDESVFVSTYSSLADEPLVQDYVAGQAAQAIELGDFLSPDLEDLLGGGLGQMLDSLGLEGSGLDLGALGGPLTDDLESEISAIIENAVHSVMTSESFAAAWGQALSQMHRQLLDALTSTEYATRGSPDLTLNLELGPIIQTIRDQMVSQGNWLAGLIPDFDSSVPLITITNIPQLRTVVSVLHYFPPYTLWVAAALVLLAIVVAPLRWLALLMSCLATAISAAGAWALVGPVGAGYLEGVPDPQLRALAHQIWVTGTDPLITNLQLVLVGSVGLGLLALAATIGVSLASLKRSRQSSSQAETHGTSQEASEFEQGRY